MEPPGPGAAKIDEKWFMEWFEQGWANLIAYLTKWAQLDAWCAEHDQKETP